MTTQQLGFSVLSAPLAAIDRRALSQAWYSALHIAREKSRAQAGSTMPAAQADARHARSRNAAVTRGLTKPAYKGIIGREAAPKMQVGEIDRRAARSALARKIERAFLHPARNVARTTFSLGGAARVHVTLQQSSSGVRLVAVCSPALREQVAIALEQARFALARRGIALHASISRSGVTC